jgi:transposase, IS6 family
MQHDPVGTRRAIADSSMNLKIAGRWVYLYRVIDQYGQVIDVLVAEKRDLVATRRFSPVPASTVYTPAK